MCGIMDISCMMCFLQPAVNTAFITSVSEEGFLQFLTDSPEALKPSVPIQHVHANRAVFLVASVIAVLMLCELFGISNETAYFNSSCLIRVKK